MIILYNRQPTPGMEGRVKLTPETGNSFYATMEMADNPLHEGTPISKQTFLQDNTAAMFGMGNDAVPDDVFAFLGKYNQHWWQRRVVTPRVGYDEVRSDAPKNSPMLFYGLSGTIYYSDSISIDQTNGAITLVNPSSLYVSYDNLRTETQLNAILNTLDGKYTTGMFSRDSSGELIQDSNVYFIPAGTYWDRSYDDEYDRYYWVGVGGNYGYYAKIVESQPYNLPAGEVSYVNSADRNSYPDSGESDGYTWVYLGIPFDNAVTAPKIATGSYIGTGNYGSSNPNSLTFDFVPKFIAINVDYENISGRSGFVVRPDAYKKYAHVGGVLGFAHEQIIGKISGNTVYWYHDSDVSQQLNLVGQTYNYIAIG